VERRCVEEGAENSDFDSFIERLSNVARIFSVIQTPRLVRERCCELLDVIVFSPTRCIDTKYYIVQRLAANRQVS